MMPWGLALCLLLVGCGGEEPLRLRELATNATVSLAEVAPRLARPGLIYVGETHTDPAHHAAQVAVIRAIHQAGGQVAVGLEMWRQEDQATLDAWAAGQLDEAAMATAFVRHWSGDWRLYADIFRFCRQYRLPMVGLNVAREITRKVAREGFASLSPEEIGLLPPLACRVDPAYENFLRKIFGDVAHGGNDAAFQRFCEAQLVWDAAFAAHALDFLASRPATTLVVVCGSVHAWKPAMPFQVRGLRRDVAQTILQPEQAGVGLNTPQDADFLLLGI